MTTNPDFASKLAEELGNGTYTSMILYGEACIRRALKRAAEVAEAAKMRGECIGDRGEDYNRGIDDAVEAIQELGGR